MIVKDDLILFPFTTPKRFSLYAEEIDAKVNFSRLSSLVVAMSIRNEIHGRDVFVFVIKGRRYLRLLMFNQSEPLVLTLMGRWAEDILRIFEIESTQGNL